MAPVVPLEAGCPWEPFSSLWLPNVRWCEAQLCSVVVEPANTWSNLAYVFAGLALLWLGRDRADRTLRLFGIAQIVVGVCSFVYHMSFSGVLQVLDFLGMYVFTNLLIGLNLVRMGRLASDRFWAVYVAGVAALTALTVVLRFTPLPIQGIVFLLIVAIVATELAAPPPPAADRRLFLAALAVLVIAAGFSAADVTGVLCDPHDHVVQGHAIWHVLASISLVLAACYYRQFPKLWPEAAGGAPRTP